MQFANLPLRRRYAPRGNPTLSHGLSTRLFASGYAGRYMENMGGILPCDVHFYARCSMTLPTLPPSPSFAPPESHRLSILLKLGDECITLLDHVSILFVLIIRSIRFDDTVDPVDCARNTIGCNELCQVTGEVCISLHLLSTTKTLDSPIKKVHRYPKIPCHAL